MRKTVLLRTTLLLFLAGAMGGTAFGRGEQPGEPKLPEMNGREHGDRDRSDRIIREEVSSRASGTTPDGRTEQKKPRLKYRDQSSCPC